jgi:N-acetyltransferase 10
VEGGGLVVLLVKTMDSLKQFYSLCMDIHSRLRTDHFNKVVPRFNERFILSLAKCNNALVMDDELNILPISSTINNITLPSQPSDDNSSIKELQESLVNNQTMSKLVGMAKTVD